MRFRTNGKMKALERCIVEKVSIHPFTLVKSGSCVCNLIVYKSSRFHVIVLKKYTRVWAKIPTFDRHNIQKNSDSCFLRQGHLWRHWCISSTLSYQISFQSKKVRVFLLAFDRAKNYVKSATNELYATRWFRAFLLVLRTTLGIILETRLKSTNTGLEVKNGNLADER